VERSKRAVLEETGRTFSLLKREKKGLSGQERSKGPIGEKTGERRADVSACRKERKGQEQEIQESHEKT